MFVFLVLCFSAKAESVSGIELVTDKEEYKSGEIVNAKITIYEAEFNTAGFALKYDPSVMTPVTPEGEEGTAAGSLIAIPDQYDGSNDAGSFSVLTRTADLKAGVMTAVFYVNPAVGKSVSAGKNGILVAEIAFKMKADGMPAVEFTTVEGNVDFDKTAGVIIDNGIAQPGARAVTKYGNAEKQNLDIDPPASQKPENSGAPVSVSGNQGVTATGKQPDNNARATGTDAIDTETTQGENSEAPETERLIPVSAVTGGEEEQQNQDEEKQKDFSAAVITCIAVLASLAAMAVFGLRRKNGGKK